MKPYVDEVSSALSLVEAEVVGAFAEDALTETDALASAGDDYETPAEALAPKPQ